MKYSLRIVSLILCITMLSLININAADYDTYFYESFDSYATNEIPEDLDINTDAFYVTEYSKGQKGLKMYVNKNALTLNYEYGVKGDFCLSFDILCENSPSNGTLSVTDGTNTANILQFYDTHHITAFNGKPLFGYGETKTTISLAYDATIGAYDIYRNGKIVEKKMALTDKKLTSLSKLSFGFSSEGTDSAIVIDNIFIMSGKKIPGFIFKSEKYPKNFNYETLEEPVFTNEINIGDRVIMNCDFEGVFPLAHHANGSIIEQRKEENGNTVLYMERVRETDFHISALGFNHQTDCLVAEFDLKVMDPATYFYIKYKDAAANEASYAYIASGGALVTKNTTTTLHMDKWYRIAQVINLYDRVIDTYVDGKKVDTEKLKENFANGKGIDLFRFHMPPTTDISRDKVKIMTDNFRIYEGIEPREEIGDVTYEIDLGAKSFVPNDRSVNDKMNGFFSVHTMSGVAFANGEKILLSKKPWTKDNVTYVDGRELADFFGLSGNFTSEMSISEFAGVSKLIPTKVDYDFNSGLYIFGKSSFKIPEDKEKLQEINDFLFYLRPDAEKILEMYKSSPVYETHPRIQATKADFDRIRELVKTNEIMKRWSEIVIKNADNLFDVPPVKYELRDGVRLLMVAREVLANMYALGMAYQITGDQKYADRAWLDLEAVCVEFWDWHPSHIIDTGELMAATAIGYDWMYHGFTDEQRAKIEKGVHDKGFYEAVMGTQSEASAMHHGMLFDDTNHNVVTNGGLLMASLAFMDVYPDITSYLAHSATRCVEVNLDKFAPDGAYFEGPHYWEYTMQYTSKMLSTLDSVFGNCFAIDLIQGLSTTSEYMLHMQSSSGIFNYGDGTQIPVYPVEILWLNNKYNNPGMFSVLMDITGGKFNNVEDYTLALLFYDPSLDNQISGLPLEQFYEREGTMAIRRSWEDRESAFVGIHAGQTNVSHSHLDGASFVYDNDGVRWAVDMGAGNYNQVGYWESREDGGRWKIFLMRAEAHNTIVVNPSLLPDHRISSFASLSTKEIKDKGVITVVDTTQLLYDVTSARRGFFFTDDRQSLVIRDEVNLTKESDVYWFMQTKANVETDENGATLIQDGKKLRLDFVSNCDAEIVFEDSKPLPTSPIEKNDKYGDANKTKRITIKAHSGGNVNITVKLTPMDITGTPVEDYDKSIDEWKVPDGPILTPPVADFIKVNGEEMTLDTNNIIYRYVEGTLTGVPEISSSSSVHGVSVQKGTTLSEPSRVIVTDAQNPENKNIYSIYFSAMKRPQEFDGYNSIPIMNVEASDEPQPENNARNVIDGDLNTRWSADGAGQTITLDLGSERIVSRLAAAFYLGNERTNRITIQVSTDGMLFENVFKGNSSGTTDQLEFYDLFDKKARYVRIVCDGASNTTWNSVSELIVMEKE